MNVKLIEFEDLDGKLKQNKWHQHPTKLPIWMKLKMILSNNLFGPCKIWYTVRHYFMGWGLDVDYDIVVYAFGLSFTIYKDGPPLVKFGDARKYQGTKTIWHSLREGIKNK